MVYWLSTVPVLEYLANVVPLDGDINLIRAVDESPDGGIDPNSVWAGRKVNTEHFPTRMRWEGPSDASMIGDFNQSNLLNVSERAKTIIKRLEPGVHQFVPVEFVDRDGNHLADRYFWVIGNRLDSVDRQHSNYVLLGGRMWRTAKNVAESFPEHLPADADPSAEPRLCFNRNQLGQAEVWRDKYFDTGGPLVSEAFAAALRAAKLTGFSLAEAGGLR